jgi:hypothetical protein
MSLFNNIVTETETETEMTGETENTECVFSGMNVNFVLTELKKLLPSNTLNGKTFFMSYRSWETISQEQKNKMVAFWKSNLKPEVRQAILDKYKNHEIRTVEDEAERQKHTNKHDLARLLHLRVDPAAAGNWCNALRAKTRPELDARGSTIAEEINYYGILAEKFNDYDNFVYHNATVVPNRKNPTTGSYVPAINMENLANFCWELNPCFKIPARPLRDGGWIREQFT